MGTWKQQIVALLDGYEVELNQTDDPIAAFFAYETLIKNISEVFAEEIDGKRIPYPVNDIPNRPS
jgi:hypothetical protein